MRASSSVTTTSSATSACAPERFADYLALTGDDVDNIPGVPGVGHETAASLMKAFDSLDDLYGNLERVAQLKLRGAGTLAQKLTRASRVGVPQRAG